jgi:uncharacterized protein YdeI (YjbR/CyaY-like superfamily)
MTPAEIKRYLKSIQQAAEAGDDDLVQRLKFDLYETLLEAIAEEAVLDPQAAAELALSSDE